MTKLTTPQILDTALNNHDDRIGAKIGVVRVMPANPTNQTIRTTHHLIYKIVKGEKVGQIEDPGLNGIEISEATFDEVRRPNQHTTPETRKILEKVATAIARALKENHARTIRLTPWETASEPIATNPRTVTTEQDPRAKNHAAAYRQDLDTVVSTFPLDPEQTAKLTAMATLKNRENSKQIPS